MLAAGGGHTKIVEALLAADDIDVNKPNVSEPAENRSLFPCTEKVVTSRTESVPLVAFERFLL